jgi:predicted DNA-binding transcriptional regulator AlpA
MTDSAATVSNAHMLDALIQFLRLPAVCARTGLSRSQVYRLEAEGKFPGRVKLGLSTSAWVESEVQAWAAARIAASRGDA